MTRNGPRPLVGLVFSFLASLPIAVAADPTPAQLEFFENRIRPVLVQHCQECHGSKKEWAGLRLDNQQAIFKGGETGPAAIPGKPDESLLIRAIRHDDDASPMPPEGKLSDAEIADLTEWVRQGLPFPKASQSDESWKRDPNHWSFQPLVQHAVPTPKQSQWIQDELDAFILQKLEKAGLSPTPAADRRTLIRRVTYDLTGLPPQPEEVASFLQDERPDAYAQLIDRLLASQAYGEHWGRHWLDVARYADSNGLDENVAHGNAWQYRDYVVSAFNRDLPYDQFVMEQIAGDLLPTDDLTEHHRRLTATGFLALGAKVLAEVDKVKMRMDIIDEQIDTLGRAFMGMTFGCARCHDHKFDPISAADYYGLVGVFEGTRTMESYKTVARWHENLLPTPASEAAKAAYEQSLAQKKQDLEAFLAAADEAVVKSIPAGQTIPDQKEPLYPEATKADLQKKRDELKAFELAVPETPAAMGVKDDQGIDVAIHLRGSHLKLGDIVPRHVPAVMQGPAAPTFPEEQSGRLELARWMVDPQHPLTSRVIVNRVWRWHFGTGLVPSTDNFGLLGEKPTHPELLDWLALRFVNEGWSLKTLHRHILLSSTYQQSTQTTQQAQTLDPENRLRGRFNVRRLNAEEVRDSLLAVSGQLDRSAGGPVLTVKNRGYLFDHTSKDLTKYTSPKRSIYLPVIRNNVYEVFQLLDYPDAAVPNGDRSSTTVAPQALMMLNSDLVMNSAQGLAERVRSAASEDTTQSIQRAYELAFSRPASPQEVAAAQQFLKEAETAFAQDTQAAHDSAQSAWNAWCQVLFASNEFVYLN